MYIREICINNFRCIKSAVIDFSKDNVLVGDNNSGKSTVLEAIDLVMGPDVYAVAPEPSARTFRATLPHFESRCHGVVEPVDKK